MFTCLLGLKSKAVASVSFDQGAIKKQKKKMMRLVYISVLILLLISCGEGPLETGDVKLAPSENYHYVDQEFSALTYTEEVYVPVYSDIYHLNGERKFSLTVTLSIRNVMSDESIFIGNVDYYDSEGKMIRKYAEKTIELKPLQSIEFIVEQDEDEGGAGANFIVSWGGASSLNPPVIQAVMIGTSSQQGISFVTDGVRINKKTESLAVGAQDTL